MDCAGLTSSSSATCKKKLNQPCHLCGVSGNSNPSVTCCVCKVSHVHLYCLHKKVGIASEKWYCEECKTLSSFRQELPDQLAIHATWKGSFDILDLVMGGTFEGVQAHLPRKGRCKEYEVASAMPNMLHLKLHPRSDVWPEKFKTFSPTEDDIALYFLPGHKRFRDRYELLSNVLAASDSALESSFDGRKLLIFSSKRLPTNSQRINEQFFLWGVFQPVGEHNSSSQPLTQKAEEFDSLPGFTTPITNACNATSPALLLETPAFATPTKPKKRGDSSDEISQKNEASETMGINAPWSSKRQRGARGTATSKYFHDPSSQPQKPTKVTKSPELADLLAHYHEMDLAKWNHQSEGLQLKDPSVIIDLLSPQNCQQPKTDGDGAFKVWDGKSTSLCNLRMLLRVLSSHGTTTVGLGHPNFGFIIGADGKACTLDDKLQTLEDVKIQDFGGGEFQMYGAPAGYSSICDRIAAKVPQLIQEAQNQVDKLCFLREKLREEKGNWEYIFVGKEEKGNKFDPFLFTVKDGISTYGGGYYCAGSGGMYAIEILKLIKNVAQLTPEEAVAWVERALLYGAINDHNSGGKYCIKIIMADRDTTTDSKFILTDLWEKHKSFFEDRYKSLGESDEISKRVMDFSRLTEESKKIWRESEDIFYLPRQWKHMAFAETQVQENVVAAPDNEGSDGDGWEEADSPDWLAEWLVESGDDEEDEPPTKKLKPGEEK